MALHATPGGHSEAAPYSRSGLYELPPCFGQRLRISGRDYHSGLTNDQGGIPHVGYDAGRFARHGFTDGNGKSLTDRGSSGDVHPGKKARHISTYSQKLTAVTNARRLDPSRQL
jgi:hypothetical protein